MKYSVDIEAGNAFVERLKVKAPKIGGFNGMVRVPSGYEKPVLVSGTDGVGTKINLARIASDYTTIGIDLVAMCVNDVICSVVCNRSRESSEKVAKEFNISRIAESWTEVVNDPEIDAICIGTWPGPSIIT